MFQLEDHRRDVRRDRAARGRDEDRVRILLAGLECSVLELEAVAECEVEALRAVRAEAFVDLRRRLGLLMRDLRAELAVDTLQSLVGDGVPSVVVDRAGREQTNLHGWLLCSGRLQPAVFVARAGEGKEEENGEPFHGGRF